MSEETLGKDGRPLIKYVVLPRQNVGTANEPRTEGMFIMSDELFFDENHDTAAKLVNKGVIEAVYGDGPGEVAPLTEGARVKAAKEAQAQAEADLAAREAQLNDVMSILTPEQLAQIQKQAQPAPAKTTHKVSGESGGKSG